MTGTPTRVFVARLAGTAVFDPNGDQVGKVRDVVLLLHHGRGAPRATGLIVEVAGRRRIFLPMTRVTSVDAGAVITTGLVNLRRFEQRAGETLALHELLDRTVIVIETGERLPVVDVAIEQTRVRDWVLAKIAVQKRSKRFGRRGETKVLDWHEVSGLTEEETGQGAASLLAALDKMRPADLATMLGELSSKRRREVAAALDDERLADVLEELDPDVQREILEALEADRAADVLEEMGPDDAADLLGELPPAEAERLLTLMEPDEAAPVRRLLTYEDSSAGGMMTSEPVILPPDATVAEALAHVRNPDLSPAMAAMVYVVRPPLETPTGRFLGAAHIQRLLREPPSQLVSALIDTDPEPLRPEATLDEVTAHFGRYNLVAAPVVDDSGALIGAVTVDDVLDHLLEGRIGADWRSRDSTGTQPIPSGRGVPRGA